MQIGERVKYIRSHIDKGYIEGEGIIRAWGLDTEQRIVVLIGDNGDVFNTFERCVNPSDAFKDQFKKLIESVELTQNEANAKIRELTTTANTRIEELHNEVLGDPIILEETAEAAEIEDMLDPSTQV